MDTTSHHTLYLEDESLGSAFNVRCHPDQNLIELQIKAPLEIALGSALGSLLQLDRGSVRRWKLDSDTTKWEFDGSLVNLDRADGLIDLRIGTVHKMGDFDGAFPLRR